MFRIKQQTNATLCIPEIFNTHFTPTFNTKNTFVNSQHENTNLNGDFLFKTDFKRSFQRFLLYKNKSDSDLV